MYMYRMPLHPHVCLYIYPLAVFKTCLRYRLYCVNIGAGCIFESLGLRKPLVVAINENLMDNHQTELSRQLANDGHLVYSTCK